MSFFPWAIYTQQLFLLVLPQKEMPSSIPMSLLLKGAPASFKERTNWGTASGRCVALLSALSHLRFSFNILQEETWGFWSYSAWLRPKAESREVDPSLSQRQPAFLHLCVSIRQMNTELLALRGPPLGETETGPTVDRFIFRNRAEQGKQGG